MHHSSVSYLEYSNIQQLHFCLNQVKSLTFTTFVINLAMEGLCDKYGDQVNLDRQNWTILKNKKYMGTLQRHHIQQRPGKIDRFSEPRVNFPYHIEE